MNWLITGGCGFLGTAFVRSLVKEGGHAVRVVDDLSVGELARPVGRDRVGGELLV